MFNYVIRRLILLPITLFCIVLVNFVIVNMAPGDPVTLSEVSQQGATRQADRSMAFGSDMRYLQFREFYGLTLPILLNTWPFTSEEYVSKTLWKLAHEKETMSVKDYDALRLNFGDRSRFIMPYLIKAAKDSTLDLATRKTAVQFFVRGGYRQAYLGPGLSTDQQAYNKKVAQDNDFLNNQAILPTDSPKEMDDKIKLLENWYNENKKYYDFEPAFFSKIYMLFFETRFFRYMNRVVHLDFGTLRNDSNKTVVSEVTKRFKYSLTLSLLPMIATTILCLTFGFLMAYMQGRWPDYTLNLFFLVLYAIPIFVVAPFLIEKVALNHYFPFTHISIPISGFTSPDDIYDKETSAERILDVFRHIFLPLIAIMYGSLAIQARLSRTAVLEVMHQDFVRTARAKGLSTVKIMFKHVGRNAAVTIVTSVAGSLGIVLGGSLIVETLFGIHGFGKFFYDAVINRDYNVIMFSALAGSFLTLIGYLVADIAYTVLDPRVTLE
jgi:peptide/nickel transport system permease protein